jgi:hypothetical protein
VKHIDEYIVRILKNILGGPLLLAVPHPALLHTSRRFFLLMSKQRKSRGEEESSGGLLEIYRLVYNVLAAVGVCEEKKNNPLLILLLLFSRVRMRGL